MGKGGKLSLQIITHKATIILYAQSILINNNEKNSCLEPGINLSLENLWVIKGYDGNVDHCSVWGFDKLKFVL